MQGIVDLDLYPLDQPGTAAWNSLVEHAQAELETAGMFNLRGFLTQAAVAQAVAEVRPKFETEAFRHARRHNIYFRRDVPDLAPDHAALREFDTVNHSICADQLSGMIVRRLYEWPEFAGFLAAVMRQPRLYTMEDPLAGVNAMAHRDGEALNWHFDRSEFTTTLLLQAPVAGGEFEYRSNLRSENDPNYDGVARLLQGADPMARVLRLDPGTLNVFRGKNTAHRVTPVSGPKPRIIAVFSYYDRPGVAFSEEERCGFYGRAG